MGVVVAVLVAADVGLRQLGETQIESTAERKAPRSDPEAAIRSFPFVPRLLASGSVPEVRVRLDRVGRGAVQFSRVRLVLHGVEVDRNALFSRRRVELESIDRGTVSADLSAPALAQALSRSEIRALRDAGNVSARVRDGRLVVTARGAEVFSIRVPRTPLVPCEGDIQLVRDHAHVTCTLEDIPPELVERVS